MEPHKSDCLFVAAPDCVGNAKRTMELFEQWKPRLAGWPVAYVLQDGQDQVPVPWDEISAIFVGGSTEFKMGLQVMLLIREAQARGKWVHVGRVNTPPRVKWFLDLEVDSIDGTGGSRYSHMREAIAYELSWH